MYKVFVPNCHSHFRNSLAMNSGPLSERMCSGPSSNRRIPCASGRESAPWSRLPCRLRVCFLRLRCRLQSAVASARFVLACTSWLAWPAFPPSGFSLIPPGTNFAGQVRQQNVGSERVLLIGGQVMRATMRTLMHDNSTETLEMFSRARFAAGTFIGDCLHSHEAA